MTDDDLSSHSAIIRLYVPHAMKSIIFHEYIKRLQKRKRKEKKGNGMCALV